MSPITDTDLAELIVKAGENPSRDVHRIRTVNGLCSMPVVHVLVSADHAVGAGEGAEQWPQVYAELLSEFAASTAQ